MYGLFDLTTTAMICLAVLSVLLVALGILLVAGYIAEIAGILIVIIGLAAGVVSNINFWGNQDLSSASGIIIGVAFAVGTLILWVLAWTLGALIGDKL